VTTCQFYIERAAECLLASAQIPSDRDVLLHMASVYMRIAIEIETREARREVWHAGASNRNAAEPYAHH
jgi:hypothetical protein